MVKAVAQVEPTLVKILSWLPRKIKSNLSLTSCLIRVDRSLRLDVAINIISKRNKITFVRKIKVAFML